MAEFIKTGKEILDDFFSNIKDLHGVDEEIAEVISALYSAGKLTDVNLKNSLENLRNKKDTKDENTDNTNQGI